MGTYRVDLGLPIRKELQFHLGTSTERKGFALYWPTLLHELSVCHYE